MAENRKNEKFRLYTHRFLYMSLGKKATSQKTERHGRLKRAADLMTHILYHVGLVVIKTFTSPVYFAYHVCYHTGQAVLGFFTSVYRSVADEVGNTGRSMKKRYRKLLEPQFKNALIIFALIAGISSLGFGGLRLVAKGLDMKGQVLGLALTGGKNLLEAKQSLEDQNFDTAENKFMLAYKSFNTSKQQLNDTNAMLNRLLSVFPQKRDAEKLFDSAALLSQTGAELIDVYKDLEGLRLAADGISSKEPLADVFNRISPKITTINNNLKIAAEKIASVNNKNVPEGYREEFTAMSGQLEVLEKSLASFKDVYELTKNLMLGDKNVLVLFENNNELRPSGGFIGTYGNLRIKDGKISKIEISSIYDLDGQLREKIAPPTPVLNANDRWYLRDSNWFLNFPDSAKKASMFYEKEGGETPDLVIAMTPELIVELLKITGSVKMPDYGISLDADNFVELVQAVSTLNEGPVNTPKQVLADFFPVLLQRLSELESAQWPLVFESLQRTLNSKHLAVFSRDSATQILLEDFNWSGKIASSDRDYLLVSSSNLGGTKTDLKIDQKIDLKTTIDSQGNIVNELTITRTNLLPKLDNTANTSFLRILAPEDAVLISNTGFDYKNLDIQEAAKGYKIDPQVYEWERSCVRDVVTGTLIGREASKTFFGNWLTIEGGESKTVKLVYRLPFKLKGVDRYSLLLQKQMGSNVQEFNWILDFAGRNVEWKNFTVDVTEAGYYATTRQLNQDHFFGAVLNKR